MSTPKEPGYKVKNTFLEVSMPDDPQPGDVRGRRARSDCVQGQASNVHHSPLVVASKSPTASPGLHPVDETMQAVPIDEVDFELLEEAAPYDEEGGGGQASMVAQQSPGLGRDEPAYVVPTTPSPFLHSAFPPTVVPPFGYGAGMGFMPGMSDMGGLPPAFGAEGEDGGAWQDADGNFMPGMFMQDPTQMYDPSMGPYMPYGWPGMAMNGQQFGGQGIGPDGQPYGFDPNGQMALGSQGGYGNAFVVDQADGGMGEAGVDGAGRKEGRRGKGRKKDLMEQQEKAGGAGGGSGGGGGGGGQRDERSKAPPQVKPGDLDAASAANQAAMDAAEDYTTVMLRNIPNKYTREMLIKQLMVDFKGLFDFMYLPIDFKNKCNVGYGFINFTTQEACEYFVRSFHGVDVRKCLPGLNSKKIVEVTPARVQGLIENVRRLRNSPVMNQLVDHPEWMPLLFNEQGVEEPFPSPDQPLPPVKPRGRARVEGQAIIPGQA